MDAVCAGRDVVTLSNKNRQCVPGAEDLFDDLVHVYLDRIDVSLEKVFHNDVLKVNNKIFAMVVRGQLVLKVPANQASSLIATSEAVAFEPRNGRKMKEWIAVDPSRSKTDQRWDELVAIAYGYVASLPKTARA